MFGFIAKIRVMKISWNKTLESFNFSSILGVVGACFLGGILWACIQEICSLKLKANAPTQVIAIVPTPSSKLRIFYLDY